MMRSRHHVEEGRGDRRSIVLTEIPYQVGKNGLVEKIAEAAKDKRIEGVSDIRDEFEPRRRPHRHRTEARRDARGRAQPAVAAHAGAVELPRQHARDPRRPPRDADAARLHRGVHPLPRGSDHPALEVRAAQGPRARPHPARPRRRGHQPRRGGPAHPRLGSARPKRATSCSRANGRATRSAPTSQLVEAVEPQAAGEIYSLSEAQVNAILELRLHRLTALGRDEIGNELEGSRRASASCSKSSRTAPASMR